MPHAGKLLRARKLIDQKGHISDSGRVAIFGVTFLHWLVIVLGWSMVMAGWLVFIFLKLVIGVLFVNLWMFLFIIDCIVVVVNFFIALIIVLMVRALVPIILNIRAVIFRPYFIDIWIWVIILAMCIKVIIAVVLAASIIIVVIKILVTVVRHVWIK